MASIGKPTQIILSTATKNTQKQRQNSTKDTIINWLFQMDYEERIKTISLLNYDICRTIIKIYEKYSTSNRLKFKINLKDKKPSVSHNDSSEDKYTSSDSYKVNQRLFFILHNPSSITIIFVIQILLKHMNCFFTSKKNINIP